MKRTAKQEQARCRFLRLREELISEVVEIDDVGIEKGVSFQ